MVTKSEHRNTSALEASPVVVSSVEDYLKRFMSFPEACQSLVASLWIIGTHIFESFDAFPYMCITASTKQAGKTRLLELIGFAANNPAPIAGASAASIYERLDISKEERDRGITPPTILVDEAESQSTGSADTMRALLNSGYRKGSAVSRFRKSYPTYCPKAFALIGDVYDTLRDRCIIVTLRRGKPAERFTYTHVQTIGAELRNMIVDALRYDVAGDAAKNRAELIGEAYRHHAGIAFLEDRDEEIWLPLFAIALILCPERIDELTRAAADLSAAKTAERRRHVDLMKNEGEALTDQYATRLLTDVHGFLTATTAIRTADLLTALKDLPTAPWRRFRGEGLDSVDLSNMLSRFGVRPRKIRFGSGRKNSAVYQGYHVDQIAKAIKEIAETAIEKYSVKPIKENL